MTGECRDIDECRIGKHTCHRSLKCVNTIGSYDCVRVINDCGKGKIFNETYNRCMDINECANNPCQPTEKCINTDGKYRCTCTCSSGYQPNKLGKNIELFQIFILDLISFLKFKNKEYV